MRLRHIDPEGLHPVPGVLSHAVVVPEARLVQETLYIAYYTPEAASSVMGALRAGATSPPPAQTLLGVAALYDPRILVEIDIVALVP